MGRRKKEPESVHREAIASAAERLFSRLGIEAATMDSIAKEAGYSKATLYVYFVNKEEIVDYLVLKSMNLLGHCISEAISSGESSWEKYHNICIALTQYQEQYPLYFNFILGKINVDIPALSNTSGLSVETEIYNAGEWINQMIAGFIKEGIERREFQADIHVLPTVFLFWSSLSGLIQMAANKRAYIEKSMNLTREQFLEFGFNKLFRMIERDI